MPGGKTRFNKSWLDEIDKNGHQIGLWCREIKENPLKAYCTLCQNDINIDNGGITQLVQHSDGGKHTNIAKVRLSASQTRITFGGTGNSSGGLLVKCHTDFVTAAEAKWAMKVASSHYSFSSCDGIGDTFRSMFPECKVARDLQWAGINCPM